MKIATDIDLLASELCETNEQKTHIVIMSNGAFGGIYQKIVDLLGGRAEKTW